jgi:hypothetical protein
VLFAISRFTVKRGDCNTNSHNRRGYKVKSPKFAIYPEYCSLQYIVINSSQIIITWSKTTNLE